MHLSGSSFRLLLVIATFFAIVDSTAAQLLPHIDRYRDFLSDEARSAPFSVSDYKTTLSFDPPTTLSRLADLSMARFQLTTSSSRSPKAQVRRIRRATINPSMVGYIEEAVIRSEVRLRFDAALDDKTPDRAEFFYAKCGCYKFVPITNSAYDPNTPGPGPGIPKDVDFQQLYFYGEMAARRNLGAFVEVPIRWLQPNVVPGTAQVFAKASGLGDIHLGFKFAPLALEHSILTFQFKASLPSGDATRGLGTNHASIEPSILYYQRLSDRLAVEAEFGDTHPLSSSAGVPTNNSRGFAGDVLFYGVGPSYLLASTEHIQLAGVMELVGWNVRSGDVTGPANPSTADINIVNLKVGPRLSIGSTHSLYFGYGIALTSQNWYRDIFRMEYRYAF
jgi:hypothetical protein